ncbi:MAG: YfhO family protein [Clostridia bacterium]|nr:YfhO family protein [Clostridia bacterium]
MRALSEKLYGKKYLGFCFIVPVFATLIVYVSMGLWPFADGSVLVLDLNAQYIYYFEKLRAIITGGGSLLYTFGRALGGEFMGIFAYYLSSPFSLVVALFPKSMMTEAILTMILLKAGTSGLTFGIFIHHLKGRRPAATVAFSVMWSLSAFCVVMQSNLMWTDCIVWLPLVLLGVDRIIQKGKFKTFVIFLSLSILSSFYIGYMVCLFIAFYFFVRYFSFTKEERNPNGDGEAANFFRALGRTALYSVVSVMIAAIVILPAYYSLSFGKLEFSTPNWEPKQLFNFLPLLSKFFFGSYDTVRPEGMPFLYCGMMVPLLLPLYFLAKDIKPRKKIAAGLIILFFFAGFNFNVFDIIWHGFQRPNWLNARFAFIFVFFILVMAYDAFIRLEKIGYGKVIATAGAVTLLLFILQAQGLDNMPDFLCVWASLGLIAVYCAVMYFTRSVSSSGLTVPGIVLAVIVSTEMILSGVANVYALDEDVVFSRRSSYRNFIDRYEAAVEMVDDDGFYRSEKLEHRKTNDNFALGLNGLSNSTSTLNEDVIRLLRQFGLTSKSHWSKYCGATATEDIFFGVKYVYADTEKTTLPHYLAFYYDKLAETDGGIAVYENPYALSPVFSAPDGMRDFEIGDEGLTDPFDLMNRLYGALTDDADRDPIYVKAQLMNMDWDDLSKFGVKDHEGFEKKGDDPSVTFTVKVTQSGVLYMYIPSTYPRDCKLYVNGTMRGKYFTNDTHCITELGSFEKGEEVTVQLNCEKDKLYIGYGIDYFYIFDEDAFVDAVNELKCTSLETTSFRDDRIEGVLTVTEGQERVMTTIPYDEGWVITANGQRVSYEKTLDALIAFDLPAGEYDIVLKYSPSCVKIGAAISAGGVLLFAGACILEALRKKKNAAVSASGEAVEIPPEDADLIFEETEAPEKPDPDVEAPDDSDETETLQDVNEITSEQEDNEEETT